MSPSRIRYAVNQAMPPLARSCYRRMFRPEAWKRESEIRRLKALPRFQAGATTVFGIPFRFTDAASFLSAYHAIFQGHVYQFKSSRPDPVILDCGANIGLSILYFKQLYPKARLTAFEPDSQVFSVLSSNCQEFGLSDVSLVNSALWREAGVLQFNVQGADGGHLTLDQPTNSQAAMASVTAVRLHDYLTQPIDMLKMDIEGAELEVLLDCEDRLRRVERLFVEYHSFVNQPQRLDELFALLRRSGFRTHLHSEGISPQPFVERLISNDKDDRLNIFAFRP